MKHIYIIVLIISLFAASPQIAAQIYSTSGYTSSYKVQPFSGYTPSADFRSTSSYSTSYEMPKREMQAQIQFANGQIQTAAAKLGQGLLADEVGYIPTLESSTANSTDCDDGSSQNPPSIAPLGLGWDAILLMLLLAAGYIFYLRRKITH